MMPPVCLWIQHENFPILQKLGDFLTAQDVSSQRVERVYLKRLGERFSHSTIIGLATKMEE